MLFVSDHGAALVDELGPRHFCGNLIDLADDEPKVLNELSASLESTDLHAIVPVGIMKCPGTSGASIDEMGRLSRLSRLSRRRRLRRWPHVQGKGGGVDLGWTDA